MDLEIDYVVAGAVVCGLACFGWAYNRWMEWLESKDLQRGFLSFLVAIGVGVTGVGYAAIVRSFEHGVVLLVCFLASGAPMMAGSVRRYVRRRAEDEESTKRLIESGFGDRQT